MIFTYNKEHVGDVLMVIVKNDKDLDLAVDRRGDIARIYSPESNQTVGWNIFNVSQIISLSGSGQVTLSDEAVSTLNERIASEGFAESLENDTNPKFVVGEIVDMKPHPDSDHLNICQVNVGQQKYQIVAGAPNARIGLKTIVALPGAMMPNGALIFPGQLRGVDSYGMMCSPRELALPNAPQKRGIIELKDNALVGASFDVKEHWK